MALSPFKDDPAYAVDKTDKTNNFNYSIPGVYRPSDLHCPFAAHAHKTNPRNVDPYLSRSVSERVAIARAACPYGTEVIILRNHRRMTQKLTFLSMSSGPTVQRLIRAGFSLFAISQVSTMVLLRKPTSL